MGLIILDIKIVSEHWEETLKQWRHTFFIHIAMVIRHCDERFISMWEFYLDELNVFLDLKLVYFTASAWTQLQVLTAWVTLHRFKRR